MTPFGGVRCAVVTVFRANEVSAAVQFCACEGKTITKINKTIIMYFIFIIYSNYNVKNNDLVRFLFGKNKWNNIVCFFQKINSNFIFREKKKRRNFFSNISKK
jgi:hypothetical protein